MKSKKGKITKKLEPRQEIFPERSQKPGIDLNIIEHRPVYIFGLNYDKGTLKPDDDTDKAKKSHEIFVSGNIEFLEGLNTPLINAYRNFIKKWDPKKEVNNPKLLSLGGGYKKYFCFCLSGDINKLLHKEEAIIEKWNKLFK